MTTYLPTAVMPNHKYFLFFLNKSTYCIYVHTCSRTCIKIYVDPLFPHTHTHCCLALFFLLPADLRFPQLFMSHLLGQVLCQMCVKQDLICPPCSSSNCVLVCMLELPLMPLQHSMVSQGTPARLSGPSCPK